jgi:hypothetical protein
MPFLGEKKHSLIFQFLLENKCCCSYQIASYHELILHHMLIREVSCPSFLSSIGFGFSDKPQPGYGFDYTLDGNCFISLDSGG